MRGNRVCARGWVGGDATRAANVTIDHVNSVTRLWLKGDTERRQRAAPKDENKIKYQTFRLFSSSLGSQSNSRSVPTGRDAAQRIHGRRTASSVAPCFTTG